MLKPLSELLDFLCIFLFQDRCRLLRRLIHMLSLLVDLALEEDNVLLRWNRCSLSADVCRDPRARLSGMPLTTVLIVCGS